MIECRSKMQTILFADISNSTRLYEQLGDARALELVNACLQIAEKATLANHGQVIKTIGDEVMCCFSTPAHAVSAAVQMQEDTSCDATMASHHIRLRIGFHHGPALHEENDLFGDAVNVAARMVQQAKAGQIITSGDTLDVMGPESHNAARLVDQARIKGKQALLGIYEIEWGQPEEMTLISTSLAKLVGAEDTASPRLRLTYQNHVVIIDFKTPVVTIGRDPNNHLVVGDPRASRLHARIELRRDKFVLVDQSTNGTYIVPGGSGTVLMRRDEIVLPDRGAISLGHQASADSDLVIRFQVQ